MDADEHSFAGGALGTPKAITAMAHKPARILWHLFKYRQAFNPEVFRKEEEKRNARSSPASTTPTRPWPQTRPSPMTYTVSLSGGDCVIIAESPSFRALWKM
jgi:hypothetical protein